MEMNGMNKNRDMNIVKVERGGGKKEFRRG